jgi:hypothetical protein
MQIGCEKLIDGAYPVAFKQWAEITVTPVMEDVRKVMNIDTALKS